MRERLDDELNKDFAENVILPQLQEAGKRYFYKMTDINLAHTCMLAETEIIDYDSAVAIIKTLLAMREEGPSVITLNPQLEDYYFNYERIFMAKAGLEAGGKLHTARSRNDLYHTELRMAIRENLLDLMDGLIELQKKFLLLADEYSETVFTGYTHMQPAQPITLGFYLSGVASQINRSIKRIDSCYQQTNLSPLGSCAFAGTGFPIDRFLVADLLGFSAPVGHTMDAIASTDWVSDIIVACCILGTSLGRFAQDLYTWTTEEFGFVELGDNISASSSIMPQKKNPIALEYLKGAASALLGSLVAHFSALKGTWFCHSKEISSSSVDPVWNALEEINRMVGVVEIVLDNVSFNKEKMLLKVRNNFCTMTSFADRLVENLGIPFRIAHGIAGDLVIEALKDNIVPEEIDLGMVAESVKRVAGKNLNLDGLDLKKIFDPYEIVAQCDHIGGPSPKETQNINSLLKDELEGNIVKQSQRKTGLCQSQKRLNDMCNLIIEKTGGHKTNG